MKPILEIQNVGKKFRLRHETKPYLSLREELIDMLHVGRSKYSREDFWALKDVSFEVQKGESIGIIGNNGAGKSTLLKILSKIIPPTHGKIISRGRIASLLEVGTGFHQELTGRENIYFNGSVLGMRRAEIDSRFDEIVEFAGTEKFLDTQLKSYSSGMQLRLAFAVAAFLEPEILVIDEVLAVGDAEFQRKCLGKMEDITKSGRTILFVSHNMQAVARLCAKAILLENGSISHTGNSEEVTKAYELKARNIPSEFKRTKIASNLFFDHVTLSDEDGHPSDHFEFQQAIKVNLSIRSSIVARGVVISCGIINLGGQRVFLTEHDYNFSEGAFKFSITIPAEKLAPGQFTLYLALHVPNMIAYDELNEVCRFTIKESGSPYLRYGGKWDCGSVVINCQWDQLK